MSPTLKLNWDVCPMPLLHPPLWWTQKREWEKILKKLFCKTRRSCRIPPKSKKLQNMIYIYIWKHHAKWQVGLQTCHSSLVVCSFNQFKLKPSQLRNSLIDNKHLKKLSIKYSTMISKGLLVVAGDKKSPDESSKPSFWEHHCITALGREAGLIPYVKSGF